MLERLAERLRRTDRNDGFIIVAVLWILAALATLAAVIAVYVINTATAFAVNGASSPGFSTHASSNNVK